MQEQEQSQRLRYFYPTRLNNDRTITDKPCLAVYSIITLILIISFFYSFILEKERNLFRPEDPDGRRCGYGEAADYPYIYFVSPVKDYLKRAVCVKQCPASPEQSLNCLSNRLVGSCDAAVGDPATSVTVYATQANSFLSLCEPESAILLAWVGERLENEWLLATIEHLYQNYLVILVVCPFVTFFLVFLYILLLHRTRDIKFLLIPVVFCFDVTLLIIAGYCFTSSAHSKYSQAHIVGYVVVTLTLVHIGYLIARRKYLLRGMELMNLATAYIRENKSLLLVSALVFVLWMGLLVLMVVLLVYLYAMDVQATPAQEYEFAYGARKQHKLEVQLLIYLAGFHYVWTNIIIYHCGKYICRAASSNWIMHVPQNFKNGLFTLFRFHIGSVVMGSALITLFAWLSSFLYFIMPDARYRACCGKWPRFSQFYKTELFTKYLGFFNELNYLTVSLDGLDFCSAGRKMTPFYVNSMQYVERAYFQARRVSQMSKILVVLVTVICCELVVVSLQLQVNLVINLIIFLFSYLLASFSFDSYDKSFETILLTILLNNDHQMKLLDKVGLAPFAEVDSSETRDEVYGAMEEWYIEESGLEAQEVMSPLKSPRKKPKEKPKQDLTLQLKISE